MSAMATAPARMSKREAEFIERLLNVVDELSDQEFAHFRKAIEPTIQPGHDGKAFTEVLESWEWMLRARRNPDYEKNMARGQESLGETFTVDDIKKQFRDKLSSA